MRVLFVVWAGRYTGAAAVAEHSCRALIAAGSSADLLFVGDDTLERRLRESTWAHPDLRKERGLRDLGTNIRVLRAAATDADAVVAHLPHDNFLCLGARVRKRTLLVRSFRNRRHLEPDLYQRFMGRRLDGAFLAHRDMVPELWELAGAVPWRVVPVPVEERFQPADGAPWRTRLGIPHGAPVLGMVGKVTPDRGFDLLLDTAARSAHAPHVIVVGEGTARPSLERQAEALAIAPRVHWAGYQEDELPALFAAMDVVLFPVTGSDHGHRAVSEAQACARPVVAARMPGIADLITDGADGLVVPRDPDALAAAVDRVLADGELAARLGRGGAAASAGRRFVPAGEMLQTFLGELRAHRSRTARGR